MALNTFRTMSRCGPGAKQFVLLRKGCLNPAVCAGFLVVPRVNLTASHGEVLPRKKPFPYKKREYLYWDTVWDRTIERLDENSKLIVVDGNTAVGKHAFAERIAKEFDMKFFPDIKIEDLFKLVPHKPDFDVRDYDEQMPECIRSCDLKKFYGLKDPTGSRISRIGATQYNMFCERFMNFIAATNHLFNTGQGVVLVRSPFSDLVYANTLAKFHYIRERGMEYYHLVRDNSICELWKPHVLIYLDAPISYVRQKITERNIPYEVNSKILSDDYLESIDTQYKKNILPKARINMRVLTYDVSKPLNWDAIIEDLEELTLDLEVQEEQSPKMFVDWFEKCNDDLNSQRIYMAHIRKVKCLLNRLPPFDCPEMYLNAEGFEDYKRLIYHHPDFKFAEGWNPETNNVYFKW